MESPNKIAWGAIPQIALVWVLTVPQASPGAEPPVRLEASGSKVGTASFVDVGKIAGLTRRNVFGAEDRKHYILETTGNGVAVFDYDGDGWLDIFLVNGTRLDVSGVAKEATNSLHRNLHDGMFQDVTEQAGLSRGGWGQGACVADYDGDGHNDLFVTYFGESILYRNTGKGTFTDVTRKLGVLTGKGLWWTGCTFFDADQDGDLDLFVAAYVKFDLAKAPKAGVATYCNWKGIPVMCGPRGLPGGTNILFRNNGDGTFSDISKNSGVAEPSGYYCFTPVASDFNNDGLIDVYVACDSTPNLLYLNRGGGRFEESAVLAGCALNEDGKEQAGMGVAATDFDHDGALDLFVTNFSDDTFTLYRNLGKGMFSDLTNQLGLGINTRFLGWGTGFVDVDQDGWKDLFAANGHVYPEVDSHSVGTSYRQSKLLYWNDQGRRFIDISTSAGPGIAEPRPARGVAFGDLDNDGRVEIVVSNMNETPSLLVNTAAAGKSIVIQLDGKAPNRNAIGGRVRVTSGGQTQMDEIRSGGSYISHNDFRLHFGIGAAERVDVVEVRWPDGTAQRFERIPANSQVLIRQGLEAPQVSRFGGAFSPWLPQRQ